MQRRLLDATVEVLVDRGYGGTTTMEVQLRAGVSRGALLHHYSSRADLMVAAVDHVSRERMDEVLSLARSAPPQEDRIAWAVRVLWGTFDGPIFTASLELWLAARIDPDLLAALKPQERIVGQAIRSMAGDLFGEPASSSPAFGDALELLIDAMRGTAARRILRSDENDERLIARWVQLMHRSLD